MTREIFEVNAPFKFTFPVEKAEQRTDGLYLVGMATGPEVDSQNERVHPSLIQKWADQINKGEITVMYRDWHQKDTSLSDLGFLTKAWVDDSDHLGVEVKLDEDHPTAVYIHKSVKKGKQYGMSVFGNVISYADEYEPTLNRNVRTFYDATLVEVSNTTRPVYTPSFGTVLSKAVSEAAAGDNPLGNEVKTTPESTASTETEATEVKTTTTTDSGAATAPDTGEAPATAADTTVEKSVKADDKKSEKALQGIVKNWTALGEQLRAAGLLSEATDGSSTSEETTVEKSETSETASTETPASAPDATVVLAKSVTDLTAIVSALADKVSNGGAPGLVVSKAEVDPLAELKGEVDPIERLRLALAVAHGEG